MIEKAAENNSGKICLSKSKVEPVCSQTKTRAKIIFGTSVIESNVQEYYFTAT
jgi:hypothetical protein